MNFTPLSDDNLRDIAPSIFAKSHDGERSKSYTLVKTSKIIDILRSAGWQPQRATEVVQRTSSSNLIKALLSSPGHQKHMVVFRSEDDELSFPDPRIKVINHDQFHIDIARVYPEIVLFNSTNGSCKFRMHGGLFALICKNGLIIPIKTIGCFEYKHQGFDPKEIYTGTTEFIREIPKLIDVVDRWSNTNLDQPQQIDFATLASKLRWDDPPVTPSQLLERSREADKGNDLWTVFNVIQDRTIKGGFKAARSKRNVRPITNIEQTRTINEGLWEIASVMLEQSA